MRFDIPPSPAVIVAMLMLGIGSSVLSALYGHYAELHERQAWLASKARIHCGVIDHVDGNRVALGGTASTPLAGLPAQAPRVARAMLSCDGR